MTHHVDELYESHVEVDVETVILILYGSNEGVVTLFHEEIVNQPDLVFTPQT